MFALVRQMLVISPVRTLVLLAIQLLEAALAAAQMLLSGAVIGRLANHGAWYKPMLGLALTFVVLPILLHARNLMAFSLEQAHTIWIRDLFAVISLTPKNVEHLEGETGAEIRSLATEVDSWLIRETVKALSVVTAARIAAVSAFAVASLWNLWCALLIAFSAAFLTFAHRGFLAAILDNWGQSGDLESARASYFLSLAMRRENAAEVRLFSWTHWLLESFREAQAKTFSSEDSARRVTIRPILMAGVVALLVTAVCVTLLLISAFSGTIGSGTVVTTLLAFLALAEKTAPQGDWEYYLTHSWRIHRRLDALANQLGLDTQSSPSEKAEPKPELAANSAPGRIELCAVSYTYPKNSAPTICNLTLEIPPGQRIAIVGSNGAGKSTLVSLIAGTRLPQVGEVSVSGCVQTGGDAGARRVAMVYQDSPRYRLTLRDNLLLGGLASDDVLKDVIDQAGLADLIATLPESLDTLLEPGLDGGRDLSGGQWQRIAIARALLQLRQGAPVIILDEPTSSLDASAEALLFERLMTLARTSTTILVSHRMASVRRADRIIVLEDGQIVEDGTPEALLSVGGRYATMFRTQAARYVFDGGE